MAIASDASAPAVVTGTGTGNLTTASFSPPAGSLLVAIAGFGWNNAGTTAIAISDSGSHTWVAGAAVSGNPALSGGAVKISTVYFATAPGSITVTAAFSGFTGSTSGPGGTYLDVWVLTGCAPSQSGAGSATLAHSSSTDGTLSITTTKRGSWVFGMADDPNSNATYTANANTTISNQYNDATDGITLCEWYATTITQTPGAITLGGTWPAATESNLAALEILPAVYPPIFPITAYSSFH